MNILDVADEQIATNVSSTVDGILDADVVLHCLSLELNFLYDSRTYPRFFFFAILGGLFIFAITFLD